MFNEDVLREKSKEVVISKINDIINKECETYGVIDTDIELKVTEEFIFAVSHTTIKSSKGMHRYGLFCFSAYGITMYYHDANVIDKVCRYTIEDVVKRTTNYFNHYAKLLNQL